MSQQKVDRYKQKKAERKKEVQKQKRKDFLWKFGLSVVAIALVGWIGYSGYSLYTSSQPRKTAEVDYGDINDYVNGLAKTDDAQ
ncbi:hypothetical protein [Lachnoclostridium sp. An181]|uniref:hypothetical protein n=1 Tax=Lachnoclostridium sp. An181 TaxID=1965575 RepID=UPI000B3A6292|nr:hypothetical protein [Lachnoclostridium sp. An181]OUP50726.1 hypothetical protein B5F18_03595 [Lachnoclostridium sp. An181]